MNSEQRYLETLKRAAALRDRRILEEDARYAIAFDQHRAALQAIHDDFEAERTTLAKELMEDASDEAADRVRAALDRLVKNHGAHIEQLPGATGVSDLAFARDALNGTPAKPSSEAAPTHRVLRDLVALHDRNTCLHEETKRGGTNWTICTQCDRKWADDEGGMPKPVDPPEVAAARRILGLPRPF